MYYFVTFTVHFTKKHIEGVRSFIREIEEIGLRRIVQTGEKSFLELPPNTWIGEYDIANKEELKDLLYNEIRRLFEKNGLAGSIFIAISENAIISMGDLPPGTSSQSEPS